MGEGLRTATEQAAKTQALKGYKAITPSGKQPASSDTICSRIAARLQEDPKRKAVSDPHECLTREELAERANSIAEQLPAGCKRVGIVMDHSCQMIAAILAILQSGAAYVPVEPDFPAERRSYIMQDAQVDCIMTDEGLQPGFGKVGAQGAQPQMPTPASIAYILYTSGTTGKPKGVMVTHANVCSYADSFAHEFKPTRDDVIMQQSVCSFDIFVEEVFCALLNGVQLAIPGNDDLLDINALMHFVEQAGITIISGFPYLLQQMNELSDMPASLRLLISGGDVLRAGYVDKIIDDPDGPDVYNTYGPSETTVSATYYRCNEGQPLFDGTYPVGKPIKGVKIAIVDSRLRPLAPGQMGEICITGGGVAKGYVGNLPEQSNFLTLPSGTRAYLSGDIGYYLPDGNLAFMHRKDAQVMIGGKRVEPAEVESVLCSCADVASGVVRAYADAQGNPYLVAYFVPASEEEHGGEGAQSKAAADDRHSIDARIRYEMSGKLAPYMVPEYFMSMLSLPSDPDDMIDMRTLPRVWKAMG